MGRLAARPTHPVGAVLEPTALLGRRRSLGISMGENKKLVGIQRIEEAKTYDSHRRTIIKIVFNHLDNS